MTSPAATKALWTVTAGVVPYHPLEEFSKRWTYTSIDYENDQNVPPDQLTKFAQIIDEVSDYQAGLSNPQYFNWVNSEFYWV